MKKRLVMSALVAVALSGAVSAQSSTQPAPAMFYYAGQGGRLTQDRDALGGNPFASALIEVLGGRPRTLSEFTGKLAAANAQHSGGWQQMQFPKKPPDPDWRFDSKGKRVALVLINADYSRSGGVYSLPGARFDAARVPEALKAAGFETTVVVDNNAEQARRAMADFATRSADADAAVIYVGGHGMQHRRIVYWMMGDYPEQNDRWLGSHAISLDEIGRTGQAKSLNLVLYASCRDDPFAP